MCQNVSRNTQNFATTFETGTKLKKNVKMDINEIWWVHLYFILLNQSWKQWWVLMTMVKNLRRHKIGDFLDHMGKYYDFKDSIP